MPSSVGSASKATHATLNGDQVFGSLLLAFFPFGCFGIFVQLPSRNPYRKAAHWSRRLSGAGMARMSMQDRGGRGGALVVISHRPSSALDDGSRARARRGARRVGGRDGGNPPKKG